MTDSSGRAAYAASMRLMWTGGAMIVVAVAVFIMGWLMLRGYLVSIGAVAGAVAGTGLLLTREATRRQRNLHPF